MTQSKSLIGIAVSLIIATLILLAGSQGSLSLQGLPLFAVCGGGSNLMSMAYPLLKEKTDIFAIESGGEGIPTGRHGATILGGGKMGILLGMKSKVVMHSAQIAERFT